ncbi:MAG: hypothetical protein KH281_12625, partial [Lachnospiraceae bacterium]|nr:hypothetical protein [Lachnospiraceae bacterium]
LHAKSIENRLRRWDFALLNHVLTVCAACAQTWAELLQKFTRFSLLCQGDFAAVQLDNNGSAFYVSMRENSA